ncbi:hypothetical protein IWW36_004682 [Coemansia brasiliensis]|uniref:Uncharacterized protein n=1 Tax=Coemansia brasiliensis TaxID=2650707 RepID=A0A9W8I588_9FUNG|nr:hypothetical protein IWW36_004682 [Coemansia brasiliensis]
MVSDSSSNTLILKSQVHARLFNAHILKSVRYKNNATPLERSIVTFSGTNSTRSLVFSRVRISGTVVHQASAVVECKERTFIYIDDGTGVVPFALCTHHENGTEQLVAREMEQRLSVASKANKMIYGLTVEPLDIQTRRHG